jgi:hypothetical protein
MFIFFIRVSYNCLIQNYGKYEQNLLIWIVFEAEIFPSGIEGSHLLDLSFSLMVKGKNNQLNARFEALTMVKMSMFFWVVTPFQRNMPSPSTCEST